MCACAVVLKLLRPCGLLRVHYWCRACYATCLLHVCYTKAAVSCPKCVRETLWLRVHYWCRACCATCLLRVCHTKAARSVCMNYVARLLRVHPPAPCLPRVSWNEALLLTCCTHVVLKLLHPMNDVVRCCWMLGESATTLVVKRACRLLYSMAGRQDRLHTYYWIAWLVKCSSHPRDHWLRSVLGSSVDMCTWIAYLLIIITWIYYVYTVCMRSVHVEWVKSLLRA